MSALKLGMLPDRTPVKLVISVQPDLHQALLDYAAVYTELYGSEEAIADLVPAMLATFLEGDREFQRRRPGLRGKA